MEKDSFAKTFHIVLVRHQDTKPEKYVHHVLWKTKWIQIQLFTGKNVQRNDKS